MAPDREMLKIGEFARLGGTTPRKLHYFERLGLLLPASREAGKTRYYIREQLDRLATVQRLRGLGLSLEWLARTLFANDGPQTGPELLKRVRAGLRQQIALTTLRAQRLQKDLEELEQAYVRIDERCVTCDIPFSQDNCDPCAWDDQALDAVIRALL